MSTRHPISLTIAGSDSSGGAGIQADLKTFAAHQVYGASVIVALTAQNTRGVSAIHAVPAAFVAQQIEGNVLTPLVQRWAVSIPPALLLFALAGLGTLFGLAGIILAAPLTVVICTVVTLLWTRDALGYDVDVPGTDKAAD